MAFRGRHHTAVWAIVALVFLGATVSAAASGAAAEPAAGPIVANRPSGWIRITDIKVVRSDFGVEIQITSDRPLRVRSRRLPNPERFVLDLPDAVFTGDNGTIDVNAADIKSVRISPLYQQEGRVTRVVLDLTTPRQIEITTSRDHLTLKLAPVRPAVVAVGTSPTLAPSSLDQDTVASTSSQSDQENHTPAEAAAEQQNSLTRRDSVRKLGESGTESAGGAAQLWNESPSPQLPETRRQSQPAPAISDQLADNTARAAVAELALEQPVPEPTLAAADNSPSDALIYGVGVTGSAQDSTLGSDIEHILGPQKQKKNKAPKDTEGGEGPLPHAFHLSGAATGGYYQAEGRSADNFHEASPIASVRLDASGYLFHPGFISFNVRPQGSLGRESSEGIFPDGQGVAASTTLLGGSASPLTLSYTRLNRKLVTFGPLDRLAGLEANTFQDSLGANWTLRLKRMPEIALSFSKYSDRYEPLEAMAPKNSNAARLGSIEMRQKVVGWNLLSRYKLERSSQDLINLFDPAQTPYLYKHKNQEARASADRDFGELLSVSFLAGATKSRNQIQDRPFDQSYRFMNGNSILRPNKKLTLSFHGGITNNIVGASLERNTGNTLTPDQPLVLVPSTARLQLVSYSVSAQYALRKDLNVHVDAVREATHPQQATTIVTPESSLTSTQAGVSWFRRLRFVRFQSDYAANIGRFVYGSAGSSRSSGHKANLGATVGSLHILELTAGVQGSMQDVTGNAYMRDRTWGTSLTLSRTFREQWKVQASYNRARDRYKYLDQQFSSEGNGFSLVLVSPRVDLTASHNMRNGLTFQADPRLQYVSSSQAGMLLGAFPGTLMALSGSDWSSASVSFHPAGKFRARGTWMRSRQQLQGAVNNRYTEWEASAGYDFRSLSFDAGYIFHDQDFGVDQFQRNRIFFRVVRDFTVF